MNLSPKKNLIRVFDSVVPSKYVHKCRRFFFFDPVYGNDIANRGRLSHYGSDERKAFAKDLKKIRKETELLIEDIEAYHIYMAVKRSQKVTGGHCRGRRVHGRVGHDHLLGQGGQAPPPLRYL